MSEKTILVVEPEAHIVRLIEVNLERAGYQVTTVDSGQDALTQINEQNFDLLVIDNTLPDMTGSELAQQISDKLQKATPPILLMLDKHIANEYQFGTWFGMPHHFMTKPFNPNELLFHVRRMFEAVESQ